MLFLPGRLGKDLCDGELGLTRRDIVRVGASGLFGLHLGNMLQLQARGAEIDNSGKSSGKPSDITHGGGGPG
ncbi:MAG: DUF1501 domain-containing protein, partial [Isosphaeraceae bacterium]